ncbi:YihY family inner membrane protein [Schauerella aestuarii]|uniref:YihY family inner membrane protein n=1 Tax=Schauerella aestuarii TaxID=2511204 RepID=UPI00136F058D|nr:YihY family inner membrane protein [Achromobacter aestuarii]MYZ46100.1 YihY family inner membrane protein [Achromobacter aestuarii]
MNDLAEQATAGGDPGRKPDEVRASWAARVLKVLRFAGAQAEEQKLIQVAASLTFTTVLAIVPMLAVVLSLFTAFPVFQEFRLALEDFLTNSLMPPTVSENIMEYLNQFARQASRLTAIGGGFLLVTSILLIMTIDQTFNDIWHVTRQRPLPQRALVYWAIVTLGPVVAGGSLWATSYLARESMGLVRDVPGPLQLAISAVPVLLTGLGFAALFVLVPNRRVYWRDALAGGFGTAIVLEIMKSGFAYYVTRFPTYTVIYGAFATLPIFLLWIYLSWLAILLGATIAASLPLIRLGRWDVDRHPGAALIDGLGALRLLYEAQGTAMPDRGIDQLARDLRLHYDELNRVMETLESYNLVARTQDNRWILACDPHKTSLAPLFDALLLDRRQKRILEDPSAVRLAQAALSGQTDVTLAQLIATDDAPDEAPLRLTDATARQDEGVTAERERDHVKS